VGAEPAQGRRLQRRKKRSTRDDAIYSINLHRGQTKSGAAGRSKAIKDVKKLTDTQIQVTLEGGDADFAYVLTTITC